MNTEANCRNKLYNEVEHESCLSPSSLLNNRRSVYQSPCIGCNSKGHYLWKCTEKKALFQDQQEEDWESDSDWLERRRLGFKLPGVGPGGLGPARQLEPKGLIIQYFCNKLIHVIENQGDHSENLFKTSATNESEPEILKNSLEETYQSETLHTSMHQHRSNNIFFSDLDHEPRIDTPHG